MSPELESRIYRDVLVGVMWDKERAEIFEMLQTNGITGESAEQMFRRAWNERVALLRSEGARKAAKGALLIAAGGIPFCVFWFGFGAITGRVFVICAVLCAWGLLRFLGGVISAIFAARKRGSVSWDND